MELSDKLKKIKQVAKSHTLSPPEAKEICAVFDLDLTEFRECYKASEEPDAWCAYWRWRYDNTAHSRICAKEAA